MHQDNQYVIFKMYLFLLNVQLVKCICIFLYCSLIVLRTLQYISFTTQ